MEQNHMSTKERSGGEPSYSDVDNPHSLRRRTGQQVASAPFAGRIGGNQEFTSSNEDLLKKQPDAAPLTSFKDALNPAGFLVYDTWRQAVIEGLGTCLLIFVVGATALGLTRSGQSIFAQTFYAALVNFVGLSLFILGAAPASGGHLNPTISMSTFFAGLSTLPRTILYITAQVTGATIGSYWLRLGVGKENFFPGGIIPGCDIAPPTSVGQLFALEYMFAQALIFIAFGVGLDPRQAKVFGSALSPILVGASLSLGTLASSLVKEGYSGISFNPARCFGLMAAKGDFQYHWVHWVAPFAAAWVNGVFYHFVPPYVRGGEKPLISHNPMREDRVQHV